MSSLYAKLIDVIERQITPMAGAIGQQKYVTSIRDGFITALPFMIVGSFLLVFIFPPFSPDTTWGFARAWLQFSLDHRDALMLPFNFSMGVMTLFIAVGIAASLAKHHHLDSLTAGMLSLMSFLLVAAPLKDGQISTAYFSGQGIFTAILVAIYSTELYAFLKRHNITIRLPPEVPAGVARSFEILIPVLAIILTLHPLNLFIEAQLGMIIPEAIMSLVKPLVAASAAGDPAVGAGLSGAVVRRDPRRADRHRDHEPVLDGQPVGQSGGHGGRYRYPAHLCPGLLGSLSADRRRRLHPAAGADAAAQQGRASADDRPDGGRAGRI